MPCNVSSFSTLNSRFSGILKSSKIMKCSMYGAVRRASYQLNEHDYLSIEMHDI